MEFRCCSSGYRWCWGLRPLGRTRSLTRLWIRSWQVVLGVGYAAVFFLYPTKPEFLLVTLPFLLLMLVLGKRQTLLTFLVLCTAVSPMYGLDIFEGRRLVGLHLTPGDYRAIIAEKPRNRVQY